jgi:hypothetical protein
MAGESRRIVVTAWVLVALVLRTAWAESPPARQQIGTWVLDCQTVATPGCVLRHRNWILPPGGGHPGVALEVQRRGDALVPVVLVRGLSTQVTVGLLAAGTQVALRFDPGPSVGLACGVEAAAIVCAPDGASIAAAATALPVAHSVEVQLQLNLPGTSTPPMHGGSLDLQDTREALARLRAGGPAGETLPAQPGLDLAGFLDRLLRAAGFTNGVADLLPRLAGAVGRGTGVLGSSR